MRQRISLESRAILAQIAAMLDELPDQYAEHSPSSLKRYKDPYAQMTGFNLEGWRCGTVACALGHYAASPAGRARGMALGQGQILMEWREGNANWGGYWAESGWDAAYCLLRLGFVELDEVDAPTCKEGLRSAEWFLFSSQSYPPHATPSMVANRIRYFLFKY